MAAMSTTWPPPVRPPLDVRASEPAATPPASRRAQVSQIPYLPGLDGLRALAVIAVMVYHADHRWMPGGYLGVEVFFVISGYLITLLLIGEQERSGRVALANFWRRRFRRLLPALFGMLILLAIYVAFFYRNAQWQVRGDFAGGVLYGSNWYQLWVGQGYAAGEAFAPLRHLWSLGVEEQFYLIWPLVMVLLLRKGHRRMAEKGPWFLAIAGFIALATGLLFRNGDVAASCSAETMNGYVTVFGRCLNINEGLYLSTFSRAGGLMLGAGMAMLWRPQAIMRGKLRGRRGRLDLIGLVGVAGLAAVCWSIPLTTSGHQFGIRYNPWLFRGGLFVTGLATLGVIAAVTHQRSILGRVLGWAPIRWVGTRSYGLYLYHWPIYQVVRKQAAIGLSPATFVLCLAVTAALTELSYQYIEMPIRRGRLREWAKGDPRPKNRVVRRRRQLVAAAGAATLMSVSFATVSMGLADQECVTRQECDNQAAAEALAKQPNSVLTLPPAPSAATTTTTIDPQPTSTDAPGVADPTASSPAPTTASTAVPASQPIPATTAAAPTGVPVFAIGESVMLGALPQLQAGGITVDAQVSRQGIGTAELLEALAPQGVIPPIVVIQTGTNGSVSSNTLGRIMAQLPPERTPLVVFLTVKAPKGWIEPNNAKIRDLPSHYPNVRVVDWQAAASAIEGELSASDGGVHLSTAHAKQFYANLVFDAIGRPDLKR